MDIVASHIVETERLMILLTIVVVVGPSVLVWLAINKVFSLKVMLLGIGSFLVILGLVAQDIENIWTDSQGVLLIPDPFPIITLGLVFALLVWEFGRKKKDL